MEIQVLQTSDHFIGLHCVGYHKEEHSDIRWQVDCVKQADVTVVVFNMNKTHFFTIFSY